MMIREKVLVSDFKKISAEYPIFIWHFLQKEQRLVPFTLQSYFDDLESILMKRNPLYETLQMVDIPYFESYLHESMDFLMDLGFDVTSIYHPKPEVVGAEHYKHYTPLVAGFKNGQLISSTRDFCYCTDGLLEVISTLDISLLEKIAL